MLKVVQHNTKKRINPNKYTFKELMIILGVALFFFIIGNITAIIGNEEINWLFVIIEVAIGAGIARAIVKKMQKEPLKVNVLISNYAILIYAFFYILVYSLIWFDFFFIDYPSFTFLIIVGGAMLYKGLKDIQTKKSWEWGGQVTKKQAVIGGIALIITSLILLFLRFIIK